MSNIGANKTFHISSITFHLKLSMESPNTNIGRQSFRLRSAIVWNNIPHWVKNIEDYHKFKCKLRSRSVAVGNISFNDSAFVSNKDLRNFKYF